MSASINRRLEGQAQARASAGHKTFLEGGTVRWQSFETIGTDPERLQRDVVFTKVTG